MLVFKQNSTMLGCVDSSSKEVFDVSNEWQGLIKSNQRAEQQQGVQLLSDIFKTTPERRRECLYYLALGNYKLGNYAEARRYNELLLEKEPGNLQAQSLNALIEDKVSKEGMMGLAIAGGVAVAAGVVGAMLMRGARAKR